MIVIYTTPSCGSCRKAKKWLEHYNIPYIEKNIFISTLHKEELKNILKLTDNGFADIISTRSKIFKSSNLDINSMKISEIINFIKKYPSILKRPIIVDSAKETLQIGYNNDDIRIFLPKYLRRWSYDCDSCPLKSEECRACESDFVNAKEALEKDRQINLN